MPNTVAGKSHFFTKRPIASRPIVALTKAMSFLVATVLRVARPCFLFTFALWFVGGVASAEPGDSLTLPVVDDPALELTLVASAPQIVTPVGIAVDAKGRLFVVESHTHFRPPSYQGPPQDRVMMFEDRDHDGQFETRSVYAEGFTWAMNLAWGADGELLLLERHNLSALRDSDGDGKADKITTLLQLQTETQYPHNGLFGFVLGPDGYLYVGMGENFGNSYTLKGSDGKTHAGAGEGGNVFRCRPDGSQLHVYATGFWNPTGLAFHGKSQLLAVDDDPETRPPNRLLDVVAGADFGFRYHYGNAADHPFVAWNGELPGTLPMLGPVGEGASGLLSTAGLNWPAAYSNSVLVTSWSDRRLEVHKLSAKGATYQTEMKVLVHGDSGFHPVALAQGPNQEVYFTDWVKRDYNVHGQGRIWRLAPRKPAPQRGRHALPADNGARRRMLALTQITGSVSKAQARGVEAALRGGDPFLQTAAVGALAREPEFCRAHAWMRHKNPRVRLGALLAFKHAAFFQQQAAPDTADLIRSALADPDLQVRLAATIWGAEGRWLKPQDGALLAKAAQTAPRTPRLRLAYRAAAKLLGTEVLSALAAPGPEELQRRLQTPAKAPQDVQNQQAAIWQLAQAAHPNAATLFEALARDKRHNVVVRADAIGALAMLGQAAAVVPLLDDPAAAVQTEAARALRVAMGDPKVASALAAKLNQVRKSRSPHAKRLVQELQMALQDDSVVTEPRPEGLRAWQQALAAGRGDANAGRRAFVHPGIGCSRCHRAADLGTSLGPPLTFIGGELPHRLLESLLDPSIDVVWSARQFELKDGNSYIGMVKQRRSDGSLILVNAAGQEVPLAKQDIVSETKADASLMPDGLMEALTVQGVRDLFAFLRSSRSTTPFENEDQVIKDR